jgi:hypothetical protein
MDDRTKMKLFCSQEWKPIVEAESYLLAKDRPSARTSSVATIDSLVD